MPDTITSQTGERRALVVSAPGGPVAVRWLPSPGAGPGEIVARPTLVGLCGTDLELVAGVVDPAFTRYPLVLGHEWTGVVESVGAGVSGLAAGDRVVAEGIIGCGTCERCRTGRTNLCATYDEVGFTRDGAASDRLLLPASLVHRLDPTVDPDDAVLAEPAAVVMHGLARVQPQPGERVLIVGSGTIALLAVQLVRLWSPSRISVLCRRPAQATLALAIGADDVVLPEDAPTLRGAHDLVIEAAGSAAALETAILAARRGGRVLVLGLPPSGDVLRLQVDGLVNDELSIVASFGSTAAAWSAVVALLGSGSIHPSALLTHRFALEDHASAFAILAQRSGAVGKVVLQI